MQKFVRARHIAAKQVAFRAQVCRLYLLYGRIHRMAILQILACVECLGGIGDFPGIEEEVLFGASNVNLGMFTLLVQVIHGFGTRVMPTVLCRLLVSARRAREIYKHFNFPLAARRSLVIGTWKQYDPLARGRRYAGMALIPLEYDIGDGAFVGDGSPPIRHWTCYFDENTTIWPGGMLETK